MRIKFVLQLFICNYDSSYKISLAGAKLYDVILVASVLVGSSFYLSAC
jgi:hypothetical protein